MKMRMTRLTLSWIHQLHSNSGMIMRKITILLMAVFTSMVLGGARISYASGVAIIANKENTVSELTLRDVKKIFKCDKQYWGRNEIYGNKIYLIVQGGDNLPTKVLLSKLYGMKGEHELKQYWLSKMVGEDASSFPHELNSDGAVKRFVSQAENAIGFIDASSVDDRVKVLRVDGKLPGDPGYVLAE